jgi:D-arabinan endo alpha-(1,5)-arabinofuranosidase
LPNNEVVIDRAIKTAQVGPPTIKVADLTGPGSSAERFGVGGTDLGIAVELADGRTGFIFGDTFDECRAGGPGWRSPVMLRSHDTTVRRLDSGITFDDAVGGDYARQLWDYTHDEPPWRNGGFSTSLPADAITIDGRLYLFTMVNRGLHNVLWTEITYSDDCGDTWHDAGPDARRLGSHNDGLVQLITWEHDPDSGWVFIIASAFNRRENAYLYRVRADDLLDRSAWHAWTGGWFRNDPAPLLPAGTTVGEMSLRRVENRWVFSFFEPSSGAIRVKVLNSPTDDFQTAPTTTVLRNTAWQRTRCSPPDGCTAGTLSQLYGGYIVPGSTLRKLHLLVSHWNTTDGSNWPYRVMQYRHNASSRL